MVELSKKTKKELRKLLTTAYARELDQHILELSMKFEDWKNRKIDCWDLNDNIHKFHDGISRKLFDAYNARGVDDLYMISRAFASNLLLKEEIPTEAIEIVEHFANTLF
ncbi:MAG: hypothetical protein H0W88_02475 [Parachlamydiaceae bacterium]|nr:hypothetical protein [Parachlamydiaceae bacterium]